MSTPIPYLILVPRSLQNYKTTLFLFRIDETDYWLMKAKEAGVFYSHATWSCPKIIILSSIVTLPQKIPEENINASEDKSPRGLAKTN